MPEKKAENLREPYANIAELGTSDASDPSGRSLR